MTMRTNNGKGDFFHQVAAGGMADAMVVIETGRLFRPVHDIRGISALDDPSAERGGKVLLAQCTRAAWLYYQPPVPTRPEALSVSGEPQAAVKCMPAT